MMFAQRRNRLTKHFSARIPVVKRRMTVEHLLKTNCPSASQEIPHILWHSSVFAAFRTARQFFCPDRD